MAQQKAKYHITKGGDVKPCWANIRTCPNGEGGHYDTKDEARSAYEVEMTAELIPEGNKTAVGKRELNQLARFTSDNDMIERAVKEGSPATYRALAKNPNVGMHQLVGAYNSTDDVKARAALALHPRFPVGKMSGDEFAAAYANADYKREEELVRDNSLNDEHLKAASLGPGDLHRVLRNPHNKISQETLIEEAEKNPWTLGNAMASGRYPAERILNLERKNIYWANIGNTDNPEYLSKYGEWAVANASSAVDKERWHAEATARDVAKNPATPAETLTALAKAGLAPETLYKNPNLHPAARGLLIKNHPEVARRAKLDDLSAELGDLKGYLMVDSNTVQPYANRGLYDSKAHFDTEKVKSLGLDKEDIFTLMEARSHYNGGFGYNEETGEFHGTIDSTD